MLPIEIVILSAALLTVALVSKRAEAGIVTPPMAVAALGLVMGAEGLGLVRLDVGSEAIRTLAEVTLVLTLFADASRIDVTALDRRHAIPIRLLFAALPLAMLLGAGAAWALFPALGLWGAAALAVTLAPTDAALGQAVVSNASVPQRIRQALNVESGLNDGLAFPALLVVATLAAGLADRGVGGWAAFVGAQVVLGPLAGLAVAFAGCALAERALTKDRMEPIYLRLSTLALPLLAYGLAEMASGNGFLAAFASGLVVAARSKHLREAAEDFGEAEGQLLELAVFVLFGAILLPELAGMGWRHALFAVLALTVLRVVPVALALAGLGLRPGTVLFLGWFGPRGLASLIYLLLLIEEYPMPGLDDLRLAVIATVAFSILAHGITASPLARRYSHAMEGGGTGIEHERVPRFSLRLNRDG